VVSPKAWGLEALVSGVSAKMPGSAGMAGVFCVIAVPTPEAAASVGDEAGVGPAAEVRVEAGLAKAAVESTLDGIIAGRSENPIVLSCLGALFASF